MSNNEIIEAPEFTGFVLCVLDGNGRERLINVSQEEYLRHRQLLPCAPRGAEAKVLCRFSIFGDD
jgi:hypothetical protein